MPQFEKYENTKFTLKYSSDENNYRRGIILKLMMKSVASCIPVPHLDVVKYSAPYTA